MLYFYLSLAFALGFATRHYGREITNGISAACDCLLFLLWAVSTWLAEAWSALRARWACRLDTLRKKLIVAAVVLFWILMVILGFIAMIAMGVGYGILAFVALAVIILFLLFLFSDFVEQVVSGLVSLVILGMFIWAWLVSLFGGIGSAIAAFWNGIGNFFAGLMKGAAVMLASLPLVMPSCAPKVVPKAEVPQLKAIQPRVVVGQTITPVMQVTRAVTPEKGEGCLRISKRGGMSLTLEECKTLSLEVGRKIEIKKGLVLAPNVALDEVWYLVREADRTWWIIH